MSMFVKDPLSILMNLPWFLFLKVEVERMRARAQDKLMSKLASTRHTADEQRAAAESKRDRSAARTAEQAEHIRRTGRMPPSLGCWNWCS